MSTTGTKTVQVRIPGSLACLCEGATVLEAEGATVGDVLVDLRGRHPAIGGRICDETGRPSPFVRVFVEDEVEITALQGLDTPVQAALRLHVLAGAAGG